MKRALLLIIIFLLCSSTVFAHLGEPQVVEEGVYLIDCVPTECGDWGNCTLVGNYYVMNRSCKKVGYSLGFFEFKDCWSPISYGGGGGGAGFHIEVVSEEGEEPVFGPDLEEAPFIDKLLWFLLVVMIVVALILCFIGLFKNKKKKMRSR